MNDEKTDDNEEKHCPKEIIKKRKSKRKMRRRRICNYST